MLVLQSFAFQRASELSNKELKVDWKLIYIEKGNAEIDKNFTGSSLVVL